MCDHITHDDLDRLVDGTLDEASRRRLLARMEAEPAAWRRCVLAFLEAQAWSEALGTLAGESIAASPKRDPCVWPVPTAAAGPRRPRDSVRRPASVLRPLALAAALLLAFGLGRWLTPPDTPAPGPVVARPEAAAPPPAPDDPTDATPPALLAEAPAVAPEVRPGGPVGDDLFAEIPADLRRRLASEGYQVEPHGGYRPVKTADGRTIRVPYQDVRVRFVGDLTY